MNDNRPLRMSGRWHALVTLFASLILALSIAACGDDGGGENTEEDTITDTGVAQDTTPEPDTTEPEPDTTEPDTEPPCECAEGQCGVLACGASCGSCGNGMSCEENACVPACGGNETFNLFQQTAKRVDEGSTNIHYVALDHEGWPTNALILDYNGPAGEPVPTGIFDAAYAFADDCTWCLKIANNITNAGYERILIPVSGEIEIQVVGNEGGWLQAKLTGVVFQEINFWSTSMRLPLVLDGMGWCVDNFDIEVQLLATQPECVQTGTGAFIGDNIADFTLPNCYGEPVNLHQECRQSKALWIVATAGWCPACAQYVPVVQENYNTFKSRGLEVLYILGEDDYYGEPSLDECLAYAAKYNLPPERVLVDWGDTWGSWETTFSNVYPYLQNGILSLPWEAVFDPVNMQYLYASTADVGDYAEVVDALNALLAR